MAEHSTIEWTDATWNPITGCAVVSPGCTNCYAMRLAGTRLARHPSRAGLTRDTKAGPVWTGEVRLNEDWLTQPLQWKRPRLIFVCAHGDLFAEGVPDEWIDRVFAVMALAPQHTFQVLTKRAARMRVYLSARERMNAVNGHVWSLLGTPRGSKIEHGGDWRCALPLPNVWLGVSAEDQRRADERIPDLLATPAAVRWISAEPLLGPIDLTNLDPTGTQRKMGAHGWSAIWRNNGLGRAWLDWVVAGGESGPGARPMHPDWARSLRDQCQTAGVAFHFKQWGAYVPDEVDGGLAGAGLPWVDEATDRSRDTVIDLRGVDCTNWHGPEQARPFALMRHVGKKAAGRLLDGRTWDEMPEVRP